MRLTLIAALAAIAIALPAFAAERITVQLNYTELLRLQLGLNALDGYQDFVKVDGKDQMKFTPYEMGAVPRLMLAHDVFVTQRAMEDFNQALRGLDGAKADDLRAARRPVELEIIDVASLNLGVNKIAPSLLAAVAPVCPSCIDGGDAPPEPKK